jgi:uncharacterized repeat protein (TIGR01451 family)
MLPTAVPAQSEQVESELIAEIRQPFRTPQGGVTYRFIRATVVPQGEVVYYTVRVRNPTTVYARNVMVVQKIPENTAYVAGSAAGPAVEVSLSADGGQTFSPEGKSAARGTEDTVSTQYTHIRWRFRNSIAPGATALARFRAVFR